MTLATVATYPLALPTFGHDKSLTIRFSTALSKQVPHSDAIENKGAREKEKVKENKENKWKETRYLVM